MAHPSDSNMAKSSRSSGASSPTPAANPFVTPQLSTAPSREKPEGAGYFPPVQTRTTTPREYSELSFTFADPHRQVLTFHVGESSSAPD